MIKTEGLAARHRRRRRWPAMTPALSAGMAARVLSLQADGRGPPDSSARRTDLPRRARRPGWPRRDRAVRQFPAAPPAGGAGASAQTRPGGACADSRRSSYAFVRPAGPLPVGRPTLAVPWPRTRPARAGRGALEGGPRAVGEFFSGACVPATAFICRFLVVTAHAAGLHPPSSPSIPRGADGLPAAEAQDGEALQPVRIYVAPGRQAYWVLRPQWRLAASRAALMTVRR